MNSSYSFNLVNGLENSQKNKSDVDIITDSDSLGFVFSWDYGMDTLFVNARFRTSGGKIMNFFRLFLIGTLNNNGRTFPLGIIGFLFHELAHKFVAQKYGCVAEFRAFDQMLYLAVGLAVAIGFIFAAPGAVMIHGQVTRKENGIISAAGPLTNFSLAMIFMGLMFYLPTWGFIFNIGFFINLWLGLFNLIPFGNFDGIKILHWNRYIWMGMVAFGVYFLFF